MKTAIVSGVIVLITGAFVIDPVKEYFFPKEIESKTALNAENYPPEEKALSTPDIVSPDKQNKFLVQSYSTIKIFDGDLNITLNDMVEYSNQNIHLVVSASGKPQKNFEQMALGDKVIYEGYEITFIDTQNNISTQDVWLKVVPLKKNT